MAWVRKSEPIPCLRCGTIRVEGIEQGPHIVHTESRCADLLASKLSGVSGRIELLETLLVNTLPYLEVAQARIGEGSIIEFLVSEIRKALPKGDP